MSPVGIIQTLDVYIFSVMLLSIISIRALITPHGKIPQSRAFSALLILNFLIILADCVTVVFDGREGPSIRLLLTVASIFGYGLQVMICLCWYWYAHIVIFIQRRFSGLKLALQAIPAAVCLAATLVSPLTGWVFSMSSDNVYHRGPLFALIVAVSFWYLINGYYMIIRYRQNLDRRHLVALLSFALPPAIGGIIQTFVYGVSLLWPGMTFSLLIIYLAIQNELLLLDYLTGINNRRSFDHALRRRVLNARDSSRFALMLIDLDNFRSINDRYGHSECDKVLKIFARILVAYFHHNGFVARYGGDEFAVIIELKRVEDLDSIRKGLQDHLDKWNAANGRPWSLSISIGCVPYIPSDKLSADNFLVQVEKFLALDKIVPGERRLRGGRRG